MIARRPSGVDDVRNADQEAGAFAGGFDDDRAAMRLEDSSAKGKAKTAALGLGSEERLEDPRTDLRRNTGTRVTHSQQGGVRFAMRLDPDLALAIHRLD